MAGHRVTKGEFDKAEGVSCNINETTSDGDYVFLHISSDKYTTKIPM